MDALRTHTTSTTVHVKNITIGQYTQVTLILAVALSIPVWIGWSLCIEILLEWLGMNEATVNAGINYTYLLFLQSLIEVFNGCFHHLLFHARKGNHTILYCCWNKR
jgi:Na+-driven multidrug efflux pump